MAYHGRPTRLKPGVEDIIISTARVFIPEEFRARPKAEAVDPGRAAQVLIESQRKTASVPKVISGSHAASSGERMSLVPR